VDRLKAKGREFAWGNDFGAEEETVLASEFDKPVIVHRYPKAIKAFYMKKIRNPNSPCVWMF